MTYTNQTYVQKSNGVIVGVFCGPFPGGEGLEQVPDGIMPHPGDLRAYWDADWNSVPLATLVSAGTAPCPQGYQLKDGQLVPMTLAQQITAGQIVVPSGAIYDATLNGGTGGVRTMSVLELGTAGLISLAVLQSDLCAMVDSWQTTLLDKGFAVTGMSANNGTFSADPTLQSLAIGVLTAVNAGITVNWPMPWPDINDNPTTIATLADFKIFAGALMACIQGVAQNIGTIKTSIRAATSTAVAVQLFNAWEASQ